MSDQPPEDEAINLTPSPLNGVIPPVQSRFGQPDGNERFTGVRTAGATVAEWYNQLARYTEAELKAVLSDAEAPAAKKTAARQWLKACKKGELPSVIEICDRTNGQSTKHVNTTSRVERVKRIYLPSPN